MFGVQMPVVQKIEVIAMFNSSMPAVFPVDVRVRFVRLMHHKTSVINFVSFRIQPRDFYDKDFKTIHLWIATFRSAKNAFGFENRMQKQHFD